MDRRAFLAGMLAFPIASCARRGSQISIGTKNFTEQLILGEILAQRIEQISSTPIERRFYLAGTYICHQALLAGRIDTYIEYTGTALGAILKERGSNNPAQVLEQVRQEYQRRFGLRVMRPLGFDNSFAVIMRKDDSQRLGVTNLTQLASHAPQLQLGVGYEFLERHDGYKGLASTYGLRFVEAPRVMDLGLLYRAIQAKRVDVIVGANTDGLIDVLGLTVLRDDRQYFPPYQAVPIVRPSSISEHPELEVALSQLAGAISAEQMRRMNYAVDGEKQDATEVARKFLQQRKASAQRLGR